MDMQRGIGANWFQTMTTPVRSRSKNNAIPSSSSLSLSICPSSFLPERRSLVFRYALDCPVIFDTTNRALFLFFFLTFLSCISLRWNKQLRLRIRLLLFFLILILIFPGKVKVS